MMTNKLKSSIIMARTTFVFLVAGGSMIFLPFVNSLIQVADAHSKKIPITQIQNCGNGGNGSGDGGKGAAAAANSPISTAAAAASGGPGGIGGASSHSTCINNINIS
jgi:hypothetical protein